MSKAVKAMVAEEIRGRYAGVGSACVVDLAGLTVQEQQQLRRRLREKTGRLEVIKNSLARQAFAGGPLELLGDALEGPCAVVTARESLIDIAKVLVEAAKEFGKLDLRHAVLEGGDFGLLSVVEVSKMKSRDELLAEIAMLVGSPGRALAACLCSPQSKIAGCLKAIVDKAA